MNENQKQICDHFVYIPQYTDKTASLNIACAATLIFHHFARIIIIYKVNYLNVNIIVVWAQYKETPIYYEKFQLQDKIEGKGNKIQINQDSESDEFNEDESIKKSKHAKDKFTNKAKEEDIVKENKPDKIEDVNLNEFLGMHL